MKLSLRCLSLIVILFVLVSDREAVAQSPVMTGKKCKVGNLLIQVRDSDEKNDDRADRDSEDREELDSDNSHKQSDNSGLVFKFYGKRAAFPTGLSRRSFRTIEQVNQYFNSTATTELTTIEAICTPTRSLSDFVVFLRETSGGSATFMVTPGSGGSITLSDGTRLSIPAGAVSETTDITVRTEGVLRVLDQGGVALVELSPDGLLLTKPATLTVPYVVSPNADPNQVETIIFSAANPPQPVVSEIDLSAPANIVAADTARSRLTIAINHFSLLGLLFQTRVLITPEIPPDHLKPGDMIFALTDTRWTPGHVGLFEKASPGTPLDQALCIESTSDPSIPNSCPGITIRGVTYGFGKGVFKDNQMSQSFVRQGRIYLGARRPKARTLTPGMRDLIIQFASAQNGACYLPVGFPLNTNQGFWSCASLVVASYFNAGVNLLPVTRLSTTTIFPYQLFQITAPVTDLTIGVGEAIQIPIKVDALTHSLPVNPLNQYAENPAGSALTMSTSPIAILDPASRVITLAPAAGQGCQSYPLTLNATGPFGDAASLDLMVKVNDFSFSQEGPIGSITVNQPQIGVQIISTCNIPIASASMKLDGVVVASFSGGNTGSTSTNLTFMPSSPLADGLHLVSVEAFDQEGAHKTDSFSFTVGTAGPSLVRLSATCVGTHPNFNPPGLIQTVFQATAPVGAGFEGGELGFEFDSSGAPTCGSWSTVPLSTLFPQGGLFQPNSPACQRQAGQPASTTISVIVFDAFGGAFASCLVNPNPFQFLKCTLDAPTGPFCPL